MRNDAIRLLSSNRDQADEGLDTKDLVDAKGFFPDGCQSAVRLSGLGESPRETLPIGGQVVPGLRAFRENIHCRHKP